MQTLTNVAKAFFNFLVIVVVRAKDNTVASAAFEVCMFQPHLH